MPTVLPLFLRCMLVSIVHVLVLLHAAVYGLPKDNNPRLGLLEFLLSIGSLFVEKQCIGRFLFIPGKPRSVEIIFFVLRPLLNRRRELIEDDRQMRVDRGG